MPNEPAKTPTQPRRVTLWQDCKTFLWGNQNAEIQLELTKGTKKHFTRKIMYPGKNARDVRTDTCRQQAMTSDTNSKQFYSSPKQRRMSKAKEAWELEPGPRSALDRKEGGKGLLNNPAWATAPPPIWRPPRAEALPWWTCRIGIEAGHDPNAKDSQGPKTPPELPFCWIQEPPVNATEPIDGRSSNLPHPQVEQQALSVNHRCARSKTPTRYRFKPDNLVATYFSAK
jgi:hypothetical protein